MASYNLTTIDESQIRFFPGGNEERRVPPFTIKIPQQQQGNVSAAKKNANKTPKKSKNKKKQEKVVEDEGESSEEEVTPFYWKNDLNKLLIALHTKHADKWTSVRWKKKSVWQMISSEIEEMQKEKGSFDYPSWKQCEGRWKTMNKAYRKTVDHNNRSGNDRKSCPYFEELDALQHDRPNVNPVATCSSSGLKRVTKRKREEEVSDDSSEEETQVEDDFGVVPERETPEAENGFEEVSGRKKQKRVRKRRYVSSVAQSTNSILNWLQTYEEKKEEREKAKEEREKAKEERKMREHYERMELFAKMIDSLSR